MIVCKRRAGAATRRIDRGLVSSGVVMVLVFLALPHVVEMKYLGPKLSHLTIDEISGAVYVGGENHLYHLDADLNLLVEVQTGPKNDSAMCFPPPGACFVNRTATNNYNKVLVVDTQRRNLITCGSVYQGMCETRSLANVTKVFDTTEGRDITNFAVAANTEHASTVAFIAPGPSSLMGTVLYVATTYTGTTRESRVYRDQVPAIATRSLHKDQRFSLAVVDNDFLKGKTSALYLKSEIASSYLIHYVHGFSSENFSYFLTVQRDQVNAIKLGRQITKIVQICQEDSYFFSYADIRLRCVKNGLDYNILETARVIYPGEELVRDMFSDGYPAGDVLVGVFSRTDEDAQVVDSAICVYTMKEIRAKFLENIKLCHQGNSSVSGGGYLRVGPRGNCNQQSGLVINNVEDDHGYLCNTNKLESFSNIVGMSPVIRHPVITYPGLRLTSLAVTVVNQFTVAFVGTEDGRLKKLVLSQEGRTKEYSEMVIDEGQRILPDIRFDAREKNLYIMTETNITRVAVETCSQSDSCNSCLNDGDPYCGWCSLEKKCVLRGNCPNSDDPSLARWLHGNTNQCIYITTISPTTASVNTVQELHLTIPQLPQTTHYTCVFLELDWSSPVTFWYFGAICKTPDFNKLGLSLGVEGFRTVTIALNSTETGKLFVTKSFSFYNCSNFHSCTSCTNSSFGCDWCVFDNGCFDETGTCQQPSIIRGKQSIKPGRHGPQHCPQIDTKATGDIFLPAGVKKTVLLKGYNIPELQSKYRNYECVIDVGSQRLSTVAKRHDDKSLTCDIPALNYAENSGTLAVNLSVFWGNNFWLESTTKLMATVYKCDVLSGGECSLCVNLNYTRPYLECFWCQNSCVHTSFCKQHASVTCPAPHIDSVWPLSGPIQGGTNITIEGSNLGAKFEDIEKAITVANVGCTPFRSLYSPSKRIVCQTKWRGQVAEGPVVIKLEKASSQFHINFQYKSPRIEDIEPKHGPKSGGSRITIKGRDMDTGGHHEAAFGNAPCVVIRNQITNDSLECITSKVWHAEPKSPVKIFFDGKEYSLSRFFVYKEDPTITRISPLESILEGGRIITVTGTEFHSVQQPKMFAYVPTITGEYYPTNTTVCEVMKNNVMKCPTPPLVASMKNIIRSKRAEPTDRSVAPVTSVQLGFIMDGVLAVRNLSGVPNLDHTLKYFPNPQVYNFTESNGIKILKGDALIIEGSNLNIAAEKSEVTVTIGTAPCNVTTFSQSQIVCKLPSTQPQNVISASGEKDRKSLPYVKVKINNLEFLVGRVEYDVPETFTFPGEAIAGIAAGGGFLLLIIVLILIIYRRQSTKAERIYRKLQIQLDNLESNVRNECKQAFAELQTDMTDLTGDLVSSGIPFWDFHSYTFKVLFPGMSDHIILHPPIQKNGRFQFSDHGLQLFHQLLGKKVFMTTFIRTLEEQRAFSIRDRANVASLLMIVYLNNMEYATEILKCLLVDLVHKSVEGRHPKLMLRRSESVVEKLLTNWLSICLYKYLRDFAGASLFMLYKAIKLQAEKGPVDAVTGDARYSLSEDTLLREKIEPRFITLNVESGGEIVQVRVLDCDTVTQAKEKILDHIYKNIPFSQRPHIRDLELEWRNGPTGPLMLADIDIASYNKDGWRRLNTLSFYHVHDGAYMSLLHRQQTIKYMNGSLDNSVLSIGSVSPILKKDQDAGYKEWHLVKHEDTLVKDGGVKMISEIFLTRLLSTKGTLQKYVDDFFKNMLSAMPVVPPVVKYLFDFLDYQAEIHGITDYEVVHTWKCNSLPLRFWVNIIKNPDFVFDISKPRIVDSCLSVVAQTFMDSCSTSEHRLGKDSPSNKLLFAKDIVHHRKLVEKYFTDIREQPAMSDQEMNAFLADISRTSPKLFYISSALGELYKYVSKYKNELMEALEQDNQANSQQLSCKLGHIVSCMEGPSGNMAYV